MSNPGWLVPLQHNGEQKDIPVIPGYEWIKKLPDKKIYFALFERWPSITTGGWTQHDLPLGYDNYIVSFHLEAVDVAWLWRQKVTGPIFVLFDGNYYDLEIPGVYFIPFFYWHYQFNTMINTFGLQPTKIPKYKFSAVSNRINQSRVWVTTKLLEVAQTSSLLVLNTDNIEDKNVHGWHPTGNKKLDDLTELFCSKYINQKLVVDDFDLDRDKNTVSFTATPTNADINKNKNSLVFTNPWQPLYQDCAINFTNESFHYSYTVENGKEYIWPGPFLTEKVLKCLLAGTAFIPVGQFETYKTLSDVGLQFDYDFDTSWDSEPGNLSRFESIIDLIDELNLHSVEELVDKTYESSKYNQNYIVSGKFFEHCHQKNEESIAQIFNLIC